MNRVETRLWLIWFAILVISMSASALFAMRAGQSFPLETGNKISIALRPDRVARKIERAAALEGVETIRIQTSATNIFVKRMDALNDLSVTLEGQFVKEASEPLTLKQSGKVLAIRVEDGVTRTPWRFAFDDENRNASLQIALPRQFSGKLSIETVSGDTTLDALSLSELSWESVSGEFQSNSGQIHVAHLKSVSGNVGYAGATLDLSVNLTSADGTIILQNIEAAITPKIDAQTVSGRLDVSVPEKASLRISISSFTGEASSSLDLKKSMQSKGALEGQLGAGGGELRLRSVSGNVRLTTMKSVSEPAQ